MADSKLGIVLEARDKASGPIKGLDNTLSGLNRGFTSLTKGAGIAAAALAAVRLATDTFELARASASSMRLASSFEDLATAAGASSTVMLAAMRKASQGTIDDTALIANANRAMLLGVGKSAEDMSKLLEIAAARGKAFGLTTAQAFDRIVLGIGRKSPLILDDLGFTLDAAKANDIYAASLGKAADQLTDSEQKQALVNAAIRESAGLLAANATKGDDLASSFERMDAALANAKDALGALFAPAAAVVAEKIAEAARAAADMLTTEPISENHQRALKQAAAEVDFYRLRVFMLSKEIETAQGPARDWLEQQRALAITALVGADAYLKQVQEIDAAQRAYSGAAAATDNLTRAHDAAAAAALNQAYADQVLAGVMREVAGIAGSYRSSLLGNLGDMGAAAAASSYRDLNDALRSQALLLDDMGVSEEDRAFFLQEYADQWLATNGLVKEHEKVLTRTATAVDKVSGKLQSILAGALNVDVGINSADLLPRQDAINEDARRLADVAVNGYASPWAAYLNTKFPALFGEAFGKTDVKTMAAQKLRDFEDGLAPELIDKERAKERLRRMLTGEANMTALAQEIAGEVSGEFNNLAPSTIQALATKAVGGVARTTQDVAGPVSSQMESQFENEGVIARMGSIGSRLAERIFAGFTDRSEGLPFADALMAIIYEQMAAKVAGGVTP